MKTVEQICTRAILSLFFTFRCGLESKFIEGKKRSWFDRDNQRKYLLDLLKENQFYNCLTSEEKVIYETKIGTKSKNKISNMYMIHETVEPLLWSVSLVDKLTSPYKICNEDQSDILDVDRDLFMQQVLSKCKLRGQADIELQRDISMLWHWRGIEGDRIPAARDVKSRLREIFGVEIERALDIIPFSKGKYSDFIVGKKEFRKLDADEMVTIQLILKWRQHAYEWILGDEEWDEVETNS